MSIIGAGASALMLAMRLDKQKFEVTVYEQNNSAGKKFLVAGHGGLNLTHSESPEQFIQRYTPHTFLQTVFNTFTNQDFMAWLEQQGIPTFVGSSGRVFPQKGMKPAQVLKRFVELAMNNGTEFKYKHKWLGSDLHENLLFQTSQEIIRVKRDLVIFCLGGASWPVTGSNQDWLSYFNEKQIRTLPFESSNCTVLVNWPKSILDKAEGKALKNLGVTCGNRQVLGEVVLTKMGLEGSGVYPLSPAIRTQLKAQGKALLELDFKPGLTLDQVIEKLNRKAKNTGEALKQHLHLSDAQIQLIKGTLSKEDFLDKTCLAKKIKQLHIEALGLGPIDDAISTVGGIDLAEINEAFELKKWPQHYALGEMLNYDAPTGGYLLQSCFSMGYFLAEVLNRK